MRLDEAVSDVDTAVTIGKFDGVHVGHAEIIANLRGEAAARGLEAVAITFDRNPLVLVKPEIAPPAITSPSQQEELLLAAGADRVVVLSFTPDLMATEPEDFVSAIFERMRGRLLYVGRDFTFGSHARGNVEMLLAEAPRYGAEVRVADDVFDPDGRRVSSTWIRDSLALGRVEDAAVMLGRWHSVRGTVVRGQQRGRGFGFPTANLESRPQGLIPADGVYAAWAVIDGRRFEAAVSVGDNPTFNGDIERVVEAHLLDVDIDVYGKQMTVEFVGFLRTMHRFEGIDALIQQMARDVEETRATLARIAR